MKRRFWTEAERDIVRAKYGTIKTRLIAQELRRTTLAVSQCADKLGLMHRGRNRSPNRQELNCIKRLSKAGECNPCIVRAIGRPMDRHTIARWRKRLGLPPSDGLKCDRCRERVKEATKRQIAAAGLSSLADVRVVAFGKYAEANGWPGDLRPREVQILNALSRGPLTRRGIAAAIGLPWIGTRKSLKASRPGGSYLAYLAARGFVVQLPRHSTKESHLYSLALTAERSFHAQEA